MGVGLEVGEMDRCIIVTLQEAEDGHVVQGVGGGVEMVRDWEVQTFVANRAEVFRKAVPEPPFGFPDVEEAKSGTADAVYHIGRCAGDHLFDVESLLGAWDGGEGG
eukprot:g14353.t1